MTSPANGPTKRRSQTGPSSSAGSTTSPISSASSRTAASRRLSPSSTPPPGVYQNSTSPGGTAGSVSRAPSSSTRPSGSSTTTRAVGRTHGFGSATVEDRPVGVRQRLGRQRGEQVRSPGGGAPQRLRAPPAGDRRVVARQQHRWHLVPAPGGRAGVGRALEQPVGVRVELDGLTVAHDAG